MHAGRAPAVGTREDRHRCRPGVPSELRCTSLAPHTLGLDRKRRKGISLAPPRLERVAGLAGYPDLPLDLRVVRLEIRVGDRPVRNARSVRDAQTRGLFELDLREAPVVGRELHSPAPNDSAVVEDIALCSYFGFVDAEGMRLVGRWAQTPLGVITTVQWVVAEVFLGEPGTLLQNDDGEASPCELVCHDGARRPGTNDDKIQFVSRSVRLHAG